MSSAIKILIIGAGQIGSRHLQGALKSIHKLSITIVDPSLDSLKLSEIRTQDIAYGHLHSTVVYTQELPKNKNFDICIISTNANVRAKVTQDLLIDCHIKHIIFEKVLFQKVLDFEIISKLIKEKDITAWVNCPRRTFLVYREIKKTLNTNNPIQMLVSGASWGMACNAIHFIDLFSYLVGSSDLTVIKKNFSKNIFKSKRGENFYEINGSIEFRAGVHFLKISCKDSKNSYLHVKIKNNSIDHSVNEFKDICKSNINSITKIKHCNMPYQSSQTGILIDNLIDKNQCELVLYQESWKHHIPLLSAIRTHLSKIMKKQLIECPIT
ncbi:Gfo/Idh/MocA family oxidoreductase [Candidatus Pelagibacter ubique]|nr:Gfo/Idh/MocA family oxidoreductase [Candidatus Pelagibacter ubique]